MWAAPLGTDSWLGFEIFLCLIFQWIVSVLMLFKGYSLCQICVFVSRTFIYLCTLRASCCSISKSILLLREVKFFGSDYCTCKCFAYIWEVVVLQREMDGPFGCRQGLWNCTSRSDTFSSRLCGNLFLQGQYWHEHERSLKELYELRSISLCLSFHCKVVSCAFLMFSSWGHDLFEHGFYSKSSKFHLKLSFETMKRKLRNPLLIKFFLFLADFWISYRPGSFACSKR